MENFKLDERLKNDCFQLGESDLSILLLMNNAAVPWFILVPKVEVFELCDLPPVQQQKLQEEINIVSQFVRKTCDIEKLNVAAIGNVVKQLHIHVIGRRSDDYCWPNVVWGTKAPATYSEDEVSNCKSFVQKEIGSHFPA